MGGHEKGEVASATVCEAMSQAILSRWNPDEPLSDDLLLQAIEEAYDALDAKDNGEAKKMGTTMTFLCFHSEGATVAHIGDSRVYQLRPAKGDAPADIIFKTRDHSLVNDLIKIGEITEEEAKNHPQKNVITRAMQPCQERRSKADIAHLTDIQAGDYFYMCSDGMLEQTSDENLLYIITKPKTKDEQKVEMLRDVTKDNKDNHTAHLIHINKVERQAVSTGESSIQSQLQKGTWITPEEPTKKSRLPFIAIASFLILALTACAYFFFPFGKNDNKEVEDDTIKKEHIVAPPAINDSASKKESPKEEPVPTSKPDDEQEQTIEEQPIENKEDVQPEKSQDSKDPLSKFLNKKRKADNQNDETDIKEE